eukprot:UN04945
MNFYEHTGDEEVTGIITDGMCDEMFIADEKYINSSMKFRKVGPYLYSQFEDGEQNYFLHVARQIVLYKNQVEIKGELPFPQDSVATIVHKKNF